jgi:hypothetical protein
MIGESASARAALAAMDILADASIMTLGSPECSMSQEQTEVTAI